MKLSMDLNNKNEKILELIENIEDLKVQVYSRDKALELQQKQIEMGMEDLREAKQFQHECKTLRILNTALETENARLQSELNLKVEREVAAELSKDDKAIVETHLSAQITDLQTQLEEKKRSERAQASKVNMLERQQKEKLDKATAEAKEAQERVRDLSQERDAVQNALTRANQAVKKTLEEKE